MPAPPTSSPPARAGAGAGSSMSRGERGMAPDALPGAREVFGKAPRGILAIEALTRAVHHQAAEISNREQKLLLEREELQRAVEEARARVATAEARLSELRQEVENQAQAVGRAHQELALQGAQRSSELESAEARLVLLRNDQEASAHAAAESRELLHRIISGALLAERHAHAEADVVHATLGAGRRVHSGGSGVSGGTLCVCPSEDRRTPSGCQRGGRRPRQSAVED